MKKFKMFVFLLFVLMLMTVVNCNGQPKTDYEVGSTTVSGATKYIFFLEKKGATAYTLTQNMDYLAPNVLSLKIGESATPLLTVNLDNDGAEYRVGVVVENVAGFYSGMGVATGTVGTVPVTPAGVFFRKKS